MGCHTPCYYFVPEVTGLDPFVRVCKYTVGYIHFSTMNNNIKKKTSKHKEEELRSSFQCSRKEILRTVKEIVYVLNFYANT